MKILKLILTFGVFASLYGCKVEDTGDVNQDKIWTYYEVLYNATDDRTTAFAQFRLDGETGKVLELNQDAAIRFNGQDLLFNSAYEGYVFEFEGLVDSGTFAYQDLDAFTFENTVMPLDSIDFPAGFDTIATSQSNTLTWNGYPLAANEQVGVFIGSWSWSNNALFVQSEENATSITLAADQLANIATGPSTVYLDRWTDVPVTEGTSKGGNVVGKYRVVKENIQIVN